MEILIILFVVVAVAALLIWAVERAPFGQPFKWILEAVICVVAALFILSRAGLV